MSARVGYAVAAGLLGILAVAGAIITYGLTGSCGLENTIGSIIFAAIVLFPITLIIGGIFGAVGYRTQRKALAVLGAILALELGISGLIQALEYHSNPYGNECISLAI